MTPTNIIELKTRPQTINEETVELLENWLEMAKSGEVISVAIAGVMDDNSSLTQSSTTDSIQLLIGSVRILEAKLIRSVLDE